MNWLDLTARLDRLDTARAALLADRIVARVDKVPESEEVRLVRMLIEQEYEALWAARKGADR